MPKPVKVTTLCENTVYSRHLIGEHGLAMLLEAQGKKILFDTGSGLTLIHNAQTLGVSLKELDAVVLSHGHYDHTGGLCRLLEMKDSINVYAHPDIFGEKCSKKDKEYQSIGIPCTRQELELKGARLSLSRAPVEISPGIRLSGEIPREKESKRTGEPLYLKQGSEMGIDPLLDDQAMIIESARGLIVLLGCAHAGLINILRTILQLTGRNQIYAVLGGTHLLGLPQPELSDTIKELKSFGLQKIAPCHCTSNAARFALYEAFGKSFLEHRAGSIFCF